jgi:hypothetical protein
VDTADEAFVKDLAVALWRKDWTHAAS